MVALSDRDESMQPERSQMTQAFDVLGIGCVAVDDLLFVEQYPAPDAKARVWRSERHCGGLTATALVAAARMGARCAYAGVLGTDELSKFAAASLRAEGICLEHTVRDPQAHAIHSTIVVSSAHQTRNIFHDHTGVVCAHPDCPSAEIITSAKVLFVDNVALPDVLRAAKIAVAAGIPIVADVEDLTCPGFDDLLALIDHLVISEDFARELSGEAQPDGAARVLCTHGRTVVVTCGSAGAWFIGPGILEPRLQSAFSVNSVDTTGCGDVFHGVYAAALARGESLSKRVRFGAAAAALKATRAGGQAGIPTRAQVETFLREQGCRPA